MEVKPLNLKERQMEYLRILKELDQFCRSTGICYYIGCGTLIGAVRHQGFIPWDDDLDVFLPEPDFKRLCSEYSSDQYKLVTCFNDKSHSFPFGRLYDLSTYRSLGNIRTYGCGIDLYVIYGAPNDASSLKKHMSKIFRLLKVKNLFLRMRDALALRRLWPKRTLDSPIINFLLRKTIKLFECYGYDDSEKIWPFGGGRLIVDKELYGTPKLVKFEDSFFYAPEYYHEVLTAGYGDYMKLPPVEEQVPYHGDSFYRL